MDVRVVATDLDGTLLRGDGTVSKRTGRAIAQAEGRGIVVVLVTARPPRILRQIARDAGVTGLAICCNGAIVYDLAADAVVGHMPLASAVAQWLVAALRAAVPGVCFTVERGVQASQDPRYAAIRPIAGDYTPLIDDALALCAADVTKLLVLHLDVPLPDLLPRLDKAIANVAGRVLVDMRGMAAVQWGQVKEWR